MEYHTYRKHVEYDTCKDINFWSYAMNKFLITFLSICFFIQMNYAMELEQLQFPFNTMLHQKTDRLLALIQDVQFNRDSIKNSGTHTIFDRKGNRVESWILEIPIKGFLGIAWKKYVGRIEETTYRGGIKGSDSILEEGTVYCLKTKILTGLLGVAAGLAGSVGYLWWKKNQTPPVPQPPVPFLTSTWNKLIGSLGFTKHDY